MLKQSVFKRNRTELVCPSGLQIAEYPKYTRATGQAVFARVSVGTWFMRTHNVPKASHSLSLLD